jgi:CDP-diacylglycerol--glycerol-3-phosphate 3-phosphatidyltransferase
MIPREAHDSFVRTGEVALLLNVPNSLTVLRIFLAPVLVLVLLTKFEGKEIWGVSIFLLGAITDALDGYLARKRGEVTSLGILLDPMADKLLTSAAFISLVQLGIVPAWMVFVIVGREFAMTDLRSVASRQGISIPASTWGKFKMGSQVTAISLLIVGEKLEEYTGYRHLAFLGQVALWLVVLLAILSFLDYLNKTARPLFLGPPRPE